MQSSSKRRSNRPSLVVIQGELNGLSYLTLIVLMTTGESDQIKVTAQGVTSIQLIY